MTKATLFKIAVPLSMLEMVMIVAGFIHSPFWFLGVVGSTALYWVTTTPSGGWEDLVSLAGSMVVGIILSTAVSVGLGLFVSPWFYLGLIEPLIAVGFIIYMARGGLKLWW